jgi:hypothetical protein
MESRSSSRFSAAGEELREYTERDADQTED